MSQTTAQLISGTSAQSPTFGATTVTSLNGGPLAGTRNRIINGGMDFWQRGTSTTTISNTYLADRWVSQFPTGGTVSQETSSLPTGSRYAWKFVASASNAFMQMGQQIEYVNCLDLQNTTVSISFMARAVTANAGSTALTVRTRTIAGIDGACIFSAAAVDTSVTLTTSWVRYTVSQTLPATFGALSLEFALGSHVSGDGIMLSQVQLEPGTVATPFERRSYGQELALCQRYFTIRNPIVNTSIAVFYSSVYWQVDMRVAPTITATPGSGSGATFAALGVTTAYQSVANSTADSCLVFASAEL